MKPPGVSQINILFVCLGNICRSPLAEGLLQKKVEAKGLEKFVFIDSCGTSDFHIGELPDRRTLRNAESHGIKLTHRGRQLHEDDFKSFHYLLVMDDSNLRNVEILKPADSSSNIMKLGEFYPPSLGSDVPDPWFGGEEGFERVFNMINESTEELLRFIEKEIELK